MSYIYSRALVAEFSLVNCSGTHACAQSSTNPMPKPSLPTWGLMLNGDVYQHPMQAHHTTVTESGLLPTPMASDWKGGTSSIRKDTGKQRLDQLRHWIKSVHGLTYPIPEHSEAVMGWPIGHTDLKPLAMDKFLNVPQLPTKSLEAAK